MPPTIPGGCAVRDCATFVIHRIAKAVAFPASSHQHFSVFISGQGKLIVNKNTALFYHLQIY